MQWNFKICFLINVSACIKIDCILTSLWKEIQGKSKIVRSTISIIVKRLGIFAHFIILLNLAKHLKQFPSKSLVVKLSKIHSTIALEKWSVTVWHAIFRHKLMTSRWRRQIWPRKKTIFLNNQIHLQTKLDARNWFHFQNWIRTFLVGISWFYWNN